MQYSLLCSCTFRLLACQSDPLTVNHPIIRDIELFETTKIVRKESLLILLHVQHAYGACAVDCTLQVYSSTHTTASAHPCDPSQHRAISDYADKLATPRNADKPSRSADAGPIPEADVAEDDDDVQFVT